MAQSKLRHTQPELNRKCVIALSILVVCLDSLDRCSSSQIATAPVGTRFYEATHPLDNHHRGALKDFLWQMDPIMFLPFKEYMSLSSTCDAYSCSKKYQVCKWHLHALFGFFLGAFLINALEPVWLFSSRPVSSDHWLSITPVFVVFSVDEFEDQWQKSSDSRVIYLQ